VCNVGYNEVDTECAIECVREFTSFCALDCTLFCFFLRGMPLTQVKCPVAVTRSKKRSLHFLRPYSSTHTVQSNAIGDMQKRNEHKHKKL